VHRQEDARLHAAESDGDGRAIVAVLEGVRQQVLEDAPQRVGVPASVLRALRLDHEAVAVAGREVGACCVLAFPRGGPSGERLGDLFDDGRQAVEEDQPIGPARGRNCTTYPLFPELDDSRFLLGDEPGHPLASRCHVQRLLRVVCHSVRRCASFAAGGGQGWIRLDWIAFPGPGARFEPPRLKAQT
jgi:hypothetical protein